VGSSHTSATDWWNSHYSCAIENQLDVIHLPFVHADTIGRGGKTVVHGPRYMADEFHGKHNMISVWFDNEVEQG
jgi:phenylpropionate dioxygenase-like ring-hydroxylating dioxygenase large terminal subunit